MRQTYVDQVPTISVDELTKDIDPQTLTTYSLDLTRTRRENTRNLIGMQKGMFQSVTNLNQRSQNTLKDPV